MRINSTSRYTYDICKYSNLQSSLSRGFTVRIFGACTSCTPVTEYFTTYEEKNKFLHKMHLIFQVESLALQNINLVKIWELEIKFSPLSLYSSLIAYDTSQSRTSFRLSLLTCLGRPMSSKYLKKIFLQLHSSDLISLRPSLSSI